MVVDKQRVIQVLNDCQGLNQAVRYANRAFKDILAAETIEEAQSIATAALVLMDNAIPGDNDAQATRRKEG